MYKDKHKTSYLNSTRAVFAGEGEFDIPIIEPTKIEESNFIGFNEAMSSKQTDCGVHFFLDDYQFERLWNNPDRYIELLQKYNCVLSPISAFTLTIRERCKFIIITASIGQEHIYSFTALR